MIEYGGRRFALGDIRDVTERNRLKEKLDLAQRMEAIGRLAGGIAHDFGNVLTIISGYCTLIRERLKAEGFLTRDSREKERRKYGLKKARKAPQYSKR